MKTKVWLLSFVLGLLSLTVQAQNSFTHTTNSGAITITGYTGSSNAVTIPASINGYPVVSIALNAFSSNTIIKSLVMPDTITSVANGSLHTIIHSAPGGGGFYFEYYYDGAFANCTNLTNVVLSTNLTSISAGAFVNCSNLTSITIPAKVTYLGIAGFYGCGKLTNVTFLGNAPGAGDPNVTFGDPANVFGGAPATIYYYYPTTGWGTSYAGKPTVELGLPYTYTLANGVATITSYNGSGGSTPIIDFINGYPVGGIGTSAFASSIVTSLIIPASVTNIGDSAFFNCSGLTNMMFLGNAPTLGSGAFNKATSLTVYYYSDAAGWGATYGGRPAVGVLPYTYTTNNNTITITGHLGGGVALTVPSSINGYPVVNIGDYAFANGNLTSISIPTGVTSVGNHAFDSCSSLVSISFPNTLTGIGQYAFYGSMFGANVTIPSSMTSVGDYAFAYCGMSAITIPNSVTNIGNSSFSYSSLSSVTIPGSVKTIGTGAFKYSGLNSVVISNGVTTISDEAFSHCEGLTSVTMPDSVTSLGLQAFAYDALTSLTIPKGLTQIPGEAFAGNAMTQLIIPSHVTSIDYSAFSGCYLLTDVFLPSSLGYLGDEVFVNCQSLTNVTFMGDVPGGNSFWFGNNGVPLVVSYYYGARGWSTNYPDTGWYLTEGGVTLVQLKWTPLLRGAGVQGNNFGFNFINTNALPVVVEASANFVDWQPIWTNVLVGYSTNFVDSQWKNYPNRFYRAR